jgi:hypothetical protein
MTKTATHLLGIRHHGPGSARQVRAMLERVRPDLIMVEGPPELDRIVQWVGKKGLKPPVAALCYDEAQPQRAVFYPFAECSPEWQALLFANQNSIPVRMMDLPIATSWEIQKVENHKLATENIGSNAALRSMSEAPMPNPNAHPLEHFAQLAGYADSDLWWEHQFEQSLDTDAPEAHFEAVFLLMKTLREGNIRAEADLENARREAYMAQLLRQARNELYANVAVVCGAWHAPALTDLDASEKAHAKILKALPKSKIKVGATWIPWTNDRLAAQSGYGAGIASPGWYRHLWKRPEDLLGERWLSKVARMFRQKKMDISTAHVIESVRLAEALAALRGLPRPGLAEFNEATRTVMCMGDDILLELVHAELIVGHAIGKVPDALPKLPLQADFEERCRKLRLAQTADSKEITLDLRKDLDLARSVFLFRLHALDIRWGKQLSARGKGTFKEIWELEWSPEMLVSLVEKGVWGNTVAEAAARFLREKADQTNSIGTLAGLIQQAIPAELFEAIEAILQKIHARAAVAAEIMELMAAVGPLADIGRYGNVRKSDLAAIHRLAEGLVVRISIGLPNACYGLNDEAAATMAERLRRTHEAVRLLENEALSEQWLRALRTVADKSEGIPPVLGGSATRLLFDAKVIDSQATTLKFSRALSLGNDPAHAAAWLEGFLKGSGAILLFDDTLWHLLYHWVAELPESAFAELLPILRRTFSTFEPGERRKLGEKARHGSVLRPDLAAESGLSLDEALAALPLDLVSKMLGLRMEIENVECRIEN